MKEFPKRADIKNDFNLDDIKKTWHQHLIVLIPLSEHANFIKWTIDNMIGFYWTDPPHDNIIYFSNEEDRILYELTWNNHV